jgi:anti-anti-sigma regulatory factor
MEWGSDLKIAISEVQGRVPITVLHVDGRINLGNTAALEQAAQEAYGRGARDFLLDLNNVTSLTSAGLRSIHWIFKLVSQAPRGELSEQDALTASASQKSKSPHIKLFATSPHVLKVLNVAGFDMYIDTYQDQNEAISAF